MLRTFSIAILIITASVSNASELTQKGFALQRFLSDQRVDQLWLPKQYVEWKTGATLFPSEEEVSSQHLPKTSHCSAYVAAVALKLEVPMLNPDNSPDGNILLANHQNAWLNSPEAALLGWAPTSYIEAETLADEGELVIASIPGANPYRNPGHIAIVVPDESLSFTQILITGPTITQAGSPSGRVPTGNSLHTDTVSGFFLHTKGSLQGIQFFHHAITAF